MAEAELFDVSDAIIDGKFNSDHPNISRYLANVNLELGSDHWDFKLWNPPTGDINRYSLVEWVGDGRYSDVFVALQDNERQVAIKILKPVDLVRVRRELKILSIVQDHPNIPALLEVVVDSHCGIASIVMEYCKGIAWRELFRTMDMDGYRLYIYQLLKALRHTHNRGIMHRDVKPLNVMCKDPKEGLALGDWGLAEFYHPLRRYTTHVGTTYYKSPEVLLGYEFYDYALDIWAVGVILLEMLTLKLHMFDADTNPKLLKQIAEVVGGQEIADYCRTYRIPIEERLLRRIMELPGIPFENWIPYARKQFRDPDALDLVSKLLKVDHKKRISADEALQHPFFKVLRDKENE